MTVYGAAAVQNTLHLGPAATGVAMMPLVTVFAVLATVAPPGAATDTVSVAAAVVGGCAWLAARGLSD